MMLDQFVQTQVQFTKEYIAKLFSTAIDKEMQDVQQLPPGLNSPSRDELTALINAQCVVSEEVCTLSKSE